MRRSRRASDEWDWSDRGGCGGDGPGDKLRRPEVRSVPVMCTSPSAFGGAMWLEQFCSPRPTCCSVNRASIQAAFGRARRRGGTSSPANVGRHCGRAACSLWCRCCHKPAALSFAGSATCPDAGAFDRGSLPSTSAGRITCPSTPTPRPRILGGGQPPWTIPLAAPCAISAPPTSRYPPTSSALKAAPAFFSRGSLTRHLDHQFSWAGYQTDKLQPSDLRRRVLLGADGRRPCLFMPSQRAATQISRCIGFCLSATISLPARFVATVLAWAIATRDARLRGLRSPQAR